jgi:hypothetical protein
MLLKPFAVAELGATIGRLLGTTDKPVIANGNQLSQAEKLAAALTRGQQNPSHRILVVDDDHASRGRKTIFRKMLKIAFFCG